MKQWCVVHTQPGKELFAEQQLMVQGFQAYLPRYIKERRHARKIETVSAPLFPRYLFVALDLDVDRWRSVNGTRGVSYLLTLDERPAVIDDSVIENLRNKENEQGLLTVDSLALFLKGDKVRILEGAFEGYTAVFEKMDDKARVQLLLNFLGRETKIEVSKHSIEAA